MSKASIGRWESSICFRALSDSALWARKSEIISRFLLKLLIIMDSHSSIYQCSLAICANSLTNLSIWSIFLFSSSCFFLSMAVYCILTIWSGGCFLVGFKELLFSTLDTPIFSRFLRFSLLSKPDGWLSASNDDPRLLDLRPFPVWGMNFAFPSVSFYLSRFETGNCTYTGSDKLRFEIWS